MTPQFNEYRFGSLRALREALKNYRALANMSDEISSSIFLDLKRVLGFDPGFPNAVLTERQRLAIQLHLIDNRSAIEVARQMRIEIRTVYCIVNQGLRQMLKALQDKNDSRRWSKSMIALLRNPDLSIMQIAEMTGKTEKAVQRAIERYREAETIPSRRRSGRAAS